ncbi:sensor histidine kinase [Pyxidicoccus sp. 3LG]
MRVETERTLPTSLRWNWRLGALIFGGWSVVGMLTLMQGWMAAWASGRAPPGARSVQVLVVDVWLWALMTPFIFTCTERFPLVRTQVLRNLGIHLVLSTLFWLLDVVVMDAVSPWVGSSPSPFLVLLANRFFICVFSYFALAGIGHALRFHGLYVERRLRASELESQLLRAQFLALQMQLRPHFLFNILNTITGLIRTGNPRGAIQMTAGLADLLRAVLRSDGTQEVPLRQELDFVERYLRLEQLRFQERLRTRIEVAPDAQEALVPHLLLQPLVENAVRHGVREKGESLVDVKVTREEDMLWLRVRDTGEGLASHERAGPEPGGPSEGGIGLANTRARLRNLYGDSHRLELMPAEGGGALVQVAIPFRRVEARL